MLTDRQLEEIAQRCAGASPGPWIHVLEAPGFWNAPQMVWRSRGPGFGLVAETCSSGLMPLPGGQQARDAVFITHAREDVPALLDEVQLLRYRLHNALDTAGAYRAQLEQLRQSSLERR